MTRGTGDAESERAFEGAWREGADIYKGVQRGIVRLSSASTLEPSFLRK